MLQKSFPWLKRPDLHKEESWHYLPDYTLYENYGFDNVADGWFQILYDLNKEIAERFEKASMAKRIISTVAASLATIGSTSIVPSLYAILNPVPPGALDESCNNPTHKHDEKTAQATAQPQRKQQAENKQGNVQFKGNILRQLQFDGNQLTPVLMTALAGGGLIAPRLNTAVKRAPIDKDTGKKDLIEVPEILVRDVTSTAAVTFGVPILTKAMVNMYEKFSQERISIQEGS